MTLKYDLSAINVAESCFWHTVSLRGTFERCLMKNFQRVQQIWSEHGNEG